MKKLEKVATMLLTFSVFFVGSTGMMRDGENIGAEEMERPVGPVQNHSIDTGKNATEEAANIINYMDYLREVLLKAKPVSISSFQQMLTGENEKAPENDRYITREEASGIVFDYLLLNGYIESGQAGNLSMFKDGLYVSSEYAGAVSELISLSIVQPTGDSLMPGGLVTISEAEDIVSGAKSFLETGGSSLITLLETDDRGVEDLEQMLSCVTAAMLDRGCFLMEGEPDIKLSSLSLLLAISRGIVPDKICEYSEERVAVMSQSGMKSLYSGMYSKGEFTVFDPGIAEENVSVLGDKLVFFIDGPQHIMDISVKCATAVKESDGSIAVYCTINKQQEYCCTAKVSLVKSGGWAAGHSISSIQLSVG